MSPQPTNSTPLVDIHPTLHGAVFDVRAFGAVGNGSTDDTTAVQAAYTAARAVAGAVLFPGGLTYIIASALDPTGTATLAHGATLKHKASVSAFNMFQPSGAFTLFGGTIDMNRSNVSGSLTLTGHIGCYLPATVGWSGVVRIVGVKITGCWGPAIRLGATTAATDADSLPVAQALVVDCDLSVANYGTFLVGLTDSRIQRNIVNAPDADGLYDYLSLRTSVVGNTVRSPGGHGIVTQYSRQFVAGDNQVYDPGTGYGIAVGGGDPALSVADRFTITGNTVRNGVHGIVVDTTISGSPSTTQNAYGTISSNVVTGNSTHGIYLQNAGYMAVTGNVAQNNANTGIVIGGYRCSVAGNVSTGNGNGIGLFGTAGSKGEHRLGGNAVTNNSSANYSIDPFSWVGSVILDPVAALATNAADGHLRVPTCAGTPTGTPSTITGSVPLVYDTTNNKLYVYNGGAWKGGTTPGAFT